MKCSVCKKEFNIWNDEVLLMVKTEKGLVCQKCYEKVVE